jgi:hypothetical protein
VHKAEDVSVLTVEEQLALDRVLFGFSCHYVDESGSVVRVPAETMKYRVADGMYEVKL